MGLVSSKLIVIELVQIGLVMTESKARAFGVENSCHVP